MAEQSRPAYSIGRLTLAATLTLAMAGCGSTRTAGVSRSWGPWASRTPASAVAQGDLAVAKKSRWSFPWRRHQIENQISAVEEEAAQAHVALEQARAHAQASVVAAKPVVRLMMPTTQRRPQDFESQPSDTMEPAPMTMPEDFSEEGAGLQDSAQRNARAIPTRDESVGARLSSRMNDIFQTGAELPGESMPGEVNVAFADDESAAKDSVEVKVDDESAPAIAPVESPEATPMLPITEAIEEGTAFAGGTPVVVEPLMAGVGPDKRGLYDNLIGRLGGVWYDNAINSEWGFMGTGETTHQWGRSNWFSHLGVAGTTFDGHSGTGVSIGISRLAKIVGKKVEKPWILGFAYDGYYDSGLFGTDNEVYVDQLRGLIGYAICPRWEMGVWAAGGLSSRDIILPANLTSGPTARYRASMGDRVAGYTAWNWGQTGIFNITSVGYQDNQTGNFFVESDAFIPLTGAINFYVGGGYSDNLGGSSDLGMGLEFTWGRTCVYRAVARHFHGKSVPKVGMLPSDTMAKGSFCREIDPCCVRYRGGWANDTYRSVFRVESPARITRRINLESIPTPGSNGEIPDGGGQGDPICPKPANPQEVLVPRKTDRPTRPGRLSELQKTEGTRNPVECRDPVTPTSTTTSVIRTAI